MLSKEEKETFLNDCEVDITANTLRLCEIVERAVLAKASQQVQEPMKDATGRSPQDYAIEHAEYLATSAEQLLNHLNECTNIDDGVIKPDENYGDYTSGLRVCIHDFRKRRDRSKAIPAPKQEPVIEVQDPWEPIDTAIEFDEIIVTGYCFGDPEKGRFYAKARRYENRFYSVNEHGEEEEIGFLTHWIYTPDSHHAKIFRKNPQVKGDATNFETEGSQ